MTSPTILERLVRARSALDAYGAPAKRSHPCRAAELLCDLMHWLDAEDLDIDDKIYQARVLFDREIAAAGSAANSTPMPAPASRRAVPTNDVLCELAHELTVRECALGGIIVDVEHDDETVYSDEAQAIFDGIYDIVSRVLETDGAEVAT